MSVVEFHGDDHNEKDHGRRGVSSSGKNLDDLLADLADLISKPSPHNRGSIYGDRDPNEGYGGYIEQRRDGTLAVAGKQIKKLYRVVNPGEWRDAKKNGYLQSAGGGGGYTRASAKPDERWRLQGLGNDWGAERGYTLEIEWSPEDNWHASAEGYAATRSRIPLSRVRKVEDNEELAARVITLWAKAKALQTFHGTDHNEKDHGKRGPSANIPMKTDWSDHPYAENIEMVPTKELARLREYNRETEPKYGESDDTLDKLTEDIRKNGITSPTVLLYGKDDKRAKLGEGNHRLAAALRLGIPAIPVRVSRVSRLPDGHKVKGHNDELDERGFTRHVNADLSPSEIGLPVYGKKEKMEFHLDSHNEKDHGRRGGGGGEWINVGILGQGGTLPAKPCSKCGNLIAFPTSKKTGKKYACDVDSFFTESGRESRKARPFQLHKCRSVKKDDIAREVEAEVAAREGAEATKKRSDEIDANIDAEIERRLAAKAAAPLTAQEEHLKAVQQQQKAEANAQAVKVLLKLYQSGEIDDEEYEKRAAALTASAQEFHGTTHNEEDHGNRGKKDRNPSFNTSVIPKDRFKVTKRTTTPAPGSDNPVAVRASRGESGTEPERRIPHRGETVDIYRDVGRGREFKRGFPDKAAFSVRNAAAVDGNSSALVKASTVGILLAQPRPSWAAAAKREAEATGKRGVHAFIRGEVMEYLSPETANELITEPGWQEVTYYPGTQDFFDPKTRRRFITAQEAVGVNGKFYVLGPEFDERTTPVSEIEKKIAASMTASAAPDDLEWWEFMQGNPAERLVQLWATLKCLKEFHLDSHNEKDHGRRGVNKVTKKGSDKVFTPTVKKKGAAPEPAAPVTPAEKKAAFVPTVKKKESQQQAAAPKDDCPGGVCQEKTESKGAWGGNGFGNKQRGVCNSPIAEGSSRLCAEHLAAEGKKREAAVRANRDRLIRQGYVTPDEPDTQPEAPKEPEPERPTLTPPAEEASVDPVTEDLASKTPSEIDHLLFPLWAERWDEASKMMEWAGRIREHERALIETPEDRKFRLRGRYEMNKVLSDGDLAHHEKKVAEHQARIDALNEKIAPYNDEFDKRGGWPRYVFVPDGHFHKERCSTCYPTTERLYVPDASGSSQAEMVEKYDYAACTVCFPEAPVEARAKYLRDQSNAKKAERDRIKAEKAAKVAEKNLVEPIRPKGGYGRIETVYAAKQWLKSFVEWTEWSQNDYHHSYQPEDADLVRDALRRKGITDDELAVMEAKWLKAAKKG